MGANLNWGESKIIRRNLVQTGVWTLSWPVRAVNFTKMTAAKVIEEIKQLAPSEQAEVIQFAVELARRRQLTAQELGELADRLAAATGPAEIVRLRSAMTRGFYGE